jgi:hypothetical protein
MYLTLLDFNNVVTRTFVRRVDVKTHSLAGGSGDYDGTVATNSGMTASRFARLWSDRMIAGKVAISSGYRCGLSE